jgi:hypothetical protein
MVQPVESHHDLRQKAAGTTDAARCMMAVSSIVLTTRYSFQPGYGALVHVLEFNLRMPYRRINHRAIDGNHPSGLPREPARPSALHGIGRKPTLRRGGRARMNAKLAIETQSLSVERRVQSGWHPLSQWSRHQSAAPVHQAAKQRQFRSGHQQRIALRWRADIRAEIDRPEREASHAVRSHDLTYGGQPKWRLDQGGERHPRDTPGNQPA